MRTCDKGTDMCMYIGVHNNCVTSTPKPDMVDHPPHYKQGGIETIDVIEAWELGYRLGNVIKYVSRAGKKGDAVEDLKKARWYLEREIANLERGTDG